MIEIALILADATTVENGKLSILGGGWNRLYGSRPHSFAIGALVEVALDIQSRDIAGDLRILDGNGKVIKGPNGKPIIVTINLHVERPDDPHYNGWVSAPLSFRFNEIPLAPGSYAIGLALGEYAAIKSFTVVAKN